MDIGMRIKEKRKEKGFTLEQLGAAAGIGKTTIMRYETGDISNIPSDRIEKIAQALGTTPAYLMGWEDKPSQQEIDKAWEIYKNLSPEKKAAADAYLQFLASNQGKG